MDIARVRTRSLGDVIDAFSVLTDIQRALPQARLHWMVEEACAKLPLLHPSTFRLRAVAMRRWRRSLFGGRTRRWRALAGRKPYGLDRRVVVGRKGTMAPAGEVWSAPQEIGAVS